MQNTSNNYQPVVLRPTFIFFYQMFQKTVEKERKNSKLSKQQAEKINSAPLKNVHHAVLAIQLRVKLPEVDRSKGDPQNILFEILSTTNNQFYKLGNNNGTLLQHYSRNQFSVCSEPLIYILKVSATIII